MNHAPIYRRRRRICLAVAVTLAAVVFHLTGPDGVDGNDPCHLTPNTPTCTLGQHP